MGKKTEKLQRVVKKLANRYGADDEDVIRLEAELKVLQGMETRRPERRSYKAADFKFQTPAKQLFFNGGEPRNH